MHSIRHLPELDAYGERLAQQGLRLQTLRVTCRTATPVASNDPVALDGVLAWAMVTEALRGRTFPPGGPTWQPLPLALERAIDGLPLWQSTDFVPVNLTRNGTHVHRRTGDNPYAMPALRHTLDEKRPRRFPNSAAGPYMDFRVPERRNLAERWEATCVGDKAEIERLLSYVQFFGKAPKRGCGFIEAWEVVAIDEPFSFRNADGELLRPLPVEDEALWIGVQQGWTPPYWLKETWRVCESSVVARMI